MTTLHSELVCGRLETHQYTSGRASTLGGKELVLVGREHLVMQFSVLGIRYSRGLGLGFRYSRE